MIERRTRGMYDEEVKTDIALIKQKVEFIENTLVNHIKEEKETLGKILDNGFVNKDVFKSHVHQDRWVFGIIITILLGVFVKLFFN